MRAFGVRFRKSVALAVAAAACFFGLVSEAGDPATRARHAEAAGGTAISAYDTTEYRPEEPVHVSIAVTPNADTLVYSVLDTPPEGWTVSDIGQGGVFTAVEGTVGWGKFHDHQARTLTYTVTPPSGESRTVVFTGAATFEGKGLLDTVEVEIVGDRTLSLSIVQCDYDVAPTSAAFDRDGGEGTVSVTTDPGCSWEASANDGWIAISPAGGAGDGAVTFRVGRHWGAAREGTITVAGEDVTITQEAGSTGGAPPIESAGPVQFVFPGAAHVTGLSGTSWVTDAVLGNPAPQETVVYLYFLKSGRDNSGAAGRAIVLPPQSAVRLEDVVADAFDQWSASGALLAAAGRQLIVSSRTYNDAPSGTYGQFVPGLRIPQAIASGETARLIQLTRNGSYRTNIGFANPTGQSLVVDVALYRSDGSVIGTREYTVQPFGFFQQTDIIGVDVADAYGLVTSDTPGAMFFTYASVIDNRTGDPVYVTPYAAAAGAGSSLYIPGSAHLQGTGGTAWRTDVEVCNPDGAGAVFDLELLVRDQGNEDPVHEEFSLDGLRCRRFTDLLNSVFGFTGAGALRITPRLGRAMATSRTYNSTPHGTFGQFIPAVLASASIVAKREVFLLQLSNSASSTSGYRTNIGLLNTSDESMTVDIGLFSGGGGGGDLGERTISLEPYEFQQADKIFDTVGAGTVANALAGLSTAVEGASFMAYGSVVDNRSGDPVYIPPGSTTGEEIPGALVLDNRLNSILVDELPAAVGVDKLEEGVFSGTLTGSGDLGAEDLPLRVTCLYKTPEGALTSSTVGIGEDLEEVGGGFGIYCFIADWLTTSDNTGGVELTLSNGGSSIKLELDATANSVLLDRLAATVSTTTPAGGFSVSSDGNLGRQELLPQLLVLFRDATTDVLQVVSTADGGILGPVRTDTSLAALILDWIDLNDNSGRTVLTPTTR